MTDAYPPKFATWLKGQSQDVREKIAVREAEIAVAPDIAHARPTGRYARLTRLMSWCAEKFGYDYT